MYDISFWCIAKLSGTDNHRNTFFYFKVSILTSFNQIILRFVFNCQIVTPFVFGVFPCSFSIDFTEFLEIHVSCLVEYHIIILYKNL